MLVLTVDPARRLATALGIEAFGNQAVRVPDRPSPARASTPQGELWAAMLDTKAGWDDLIRRHAPDAEVRDAVLDNPLYQNITSRFVHSHDYLAMEQLHDLHATGQYDLVIVDTPPSRNALDILDAPSRMVEFFGSRLLRWLTVPYRSRLFSAASKPFYQIADRVLGSHFLRDIADFFILFQAMEKGFVVTRSPGRGPARRPSNGVRGRVHARGGTRPRGRVPRRRAESPQIPARRDHRQPGAPRGAVARMPLGEARRASAAVVDDPAALRSIAAALDAEDDVTGAVLAEIATRFHDVALVATREAERSAELATLAPVLLTAPTLDRDVTDVGGLVALACALRGGDTPPDDAVDRGAPCVAGWIRQTASDGSARRSRTRAHTVAP